MVDAAILTGSKPQAVTPGRGAQRDAGGETPRDPEAGFSALLVAVEEIAALGGLTLPNQAAPVPAAPAEGQPIASTEALAPRLGRELSALIRQRIEAQTTEGRDAAGAGERRSEEGRKPAQPQLREVGHHRARQPALRGNPFQSYAHGAAQHMNPHLSAQAMSADEQAILQELQQLKQAAGAPKLESQVASTPKLEAALQQHASGETSNPVVRQVANNLQFVARGQTERLRVDLHPEELGRVQIELQKTGGATRILIVTETAQAFEALQRGAGGLQNSLSQAGFDADDMRFEHREWREGQQQPEADERRDRDERHARRGTDDERREVLIRPAVAAERHLFL